MWAQGVALGTASHPELPGSTRVTLRLLTQPACRFFFLFFFPFSPTVPSLRELSSRVGWEIYTPTIKDAELGCVPDDTTTTHPPPIEESETRFYKKKRGGHSKSTTPLVFTFLSFASFPLVSYPRFKASCSYARLHNLIKVPSGETCLRKPLPLNVRDLLPSAVLLWANQTAAKTLLAH